MLMSMGIGTLCGIVLGNIVLGILFGLAIITIRSHFSQKQ